MARALQEIRSAVSDHYRVDFDSVLVNLYRDGRDGVAWHGDTVRKTLPEAVVVTVGLGERRRFLLRPGTSGPPAVRLETGQGDLVVMGGRTQHEWQHTVPKAAKAGARMSITMRHSRPLTGADAPHEANSRPSSRAGLLRATVHGPNVVNCGSGADGHGVKEMIDPAGVVALLVANSLPWCHSMAAGDGTDSTVWRLWWEIVEMRLPNSSAT